MNDENPLHSLPAPTPFGLESPVLWPSLSLTMRELECAIADIGRADLPVLLVGERGTGKEIVAREIHRHHGGAAETFLPVRCAEHDPGFLRELFVQTAQAASRMPGRSVTVFLDEIGELDLSNQAVLVGLIADGKDKVHSERLVSSSSHNLEDQIQKQRFREDLFYRLNGVSLWVPPLRQRKEDIPVLTEFFLEQHARALGRTPTALQPKTLQVLLDHSWPGNVRELKEVVRKILLSDELTALADLRPSVASPRTAREFTAAPSLKEAARNASRKVERELILKTLSRTRWNRKRAARELGISYKALLYKLKQIAFDDPTEI